MSGIKKINRGIYSDSGGVVGTVLPGGQGSTNKIPPAGICCQLAQVTLQGAGVALIAGTTYWLVATTDDAAAPTFTGVWQGSNTANIGINTFSAPTGGWFKNGLFWPAGGISGTSP